jgi:hypothetical protein
MKSETVNRRKGETAHASADSSILRFADSVVQERLHSLLHSLL